MYDYGSAEDNMKHYGVVSVGVCVGRVVESEGVCVGRVVDSEVCVCWEGGGEVGWCVGRVVYRKEREEHGASVLHTEKDEISWL